MNINSRRPLFHKRPQSNIYRMFLWVVMLLGGVWILQQLDRGEIQPLFLPTAIPTRAAMSYLEEGDAQFTAGNVTAAILAYQEALRMNPNDAQTWAKLARIQTYSSAFLITNDEKEARLREALESATKAVGWHRKIALCVPFAPLRWIGMPTEAFIRRRKWTISCSKPKMRRNSRNSWITKTRWRWLTLPRS